MIKIKHNTWVVPYGHGEVGKYRSVCNCGWTSAPGFYFEVEGDGKLHVEVASNPDKYK